MRAPLTALFCLTLQSVRTRRIPPLRRPQATPRPTSSFVEGFVDIVHEGVSERADPPEMLVDGDIIRTGNGRAEIVFGDGTLLHLDNGAQLEMLSPERLRLSEGRVIAARLGSGQAAYFIDTPGGTVRMNARGEYGVSAFRAKRGSKYPRRAARRGN